VVVLRNDDRRADPEPGDPQQLSIGLHDQAIENKFQWLNHEPVEYTNWGTGEPNNSRAEDFTVMNSNGTWNDLDSTFIVSAIVEIPCAGDLDGDGTVGGAYLAVLLGGWGPCAVSNACSAHAGTGLNQPVCTKCVCDLDPFCCQVQWDNLCADQAQQPVQRRLPVRRVIGERRSPTDGGIRTTGRRESAAPFALVRRLSDEIVAIVSGERFRLADNSSQPRQPPTPPLSAGATWCDLGDASVLLSDVDAASADFPFRFPSPS
jgi:hypothetical protein